MNMQHIRIMSPQIAAETPQSTTRKKERACSRLQGSFRNSKDVAVNWDGLKSLSGRKIFGPPVRNNQWDVATQLLLVGELANNFLYATDMRVK